MSTKRTLGAVALIAVLALAWAGYTFLYRADTNGPTKVVVAQVGEFFLYMPVYLAEGKGFFRDEGLEVSIVNTGGDDKSVAAVIAGSADFGIGDPTFAAIAGLQGQAVVVVASVVNGVPFWGITKNPKVPEVTTPSQLRGFSVATFPSPSTAYTLQAQMFRTAGLDPNIRQVQFGSLLPLLDTGTVDIVLELEPNVSTATNKGARVVYSLAKEYGDFAITGATVSQRTLSERRHVVQRFVKALDRAQKYMHENRDAAVAFAKGRFPSIEPQVAAEAMVRSLDNQIFPTSALTPASAWAKAIKLRVDAGDIPDAKAAEPFLDNSVAQSVQ